MLEKTLQSPLDCEKITPVHPKGNQSWIFIERTDTKAEIPVLWPPHAKSSLVGKNSDAGRDWGQEEKGTTEVEVAGWHHWLDGRESEWTSGVGVGQGGLACCDSWGRKELDMTEQLNWTELNWRLEGTGNPLQYSCLENPMDRGAWWATVHGSQSPTQLSDFTFKKCRQKKVCPLLLENSRPLSPFRELQTPFFSLGTLDFLSICLGINSLRS